MHLGAEHATDSVSTAFVYYSNENFKSVNMIYISASFWGSVFLRVWQSLLCLLVAFSGISQDVIELGNNRELFVDSYLIDKLEGLNLQMHEPRNEGIVLKLDKPWEGAFSLYTTIIKDGTLFRAFYRGVPTSGHDGNKGEVTCYAESDDGIHWRKPNLGIYKIDGTWDNNVILADMAPVTHNFSPFLDKNPNALSTQRFKALGGTGSGGLYAFASADGIHWDQLSEKAVYTTGRFDSQNVSFWSESEQKYVCYFRTSAKENSKAFRSVGRTTSADFINWSDSVQMTFGGTSLEHLYTQQTSPYYRAPQIYMAIGARFMPDRQVVSDEQAALLNVDPKYYKDCSDAFLMVTRGGNSFDRTFMESFIRPGIGLQNWVSRTNYPALNVVQTSDTEMSIYVNEDYAQHSAHIKRYVLRIDGFASLSADYEGGEMVSKQFVVKGKDLDINYSTSAAGFLRVELQDESGAVIPGFALEDCQEIIGNEISRKVAWKNGSSLKSILGKTVRMRVQMKDANLYSIKFLEP